MEAACLFSRRFRPPETKYSMFDRELLAVYLTIRHFHFFLEGCSFMIFTDQKLLTLAIKKSLDQQSAHQGRHLAAIAEYSTNIQHVAGKANPIADALGRLLTPSSPCAIANIIIPPAVMQVSSSVQVQPPLVVRAGSPAIGTTTAAALVQQGGELHMGPSDRVWPAKVVRAGPPAVGTTKVVAPVLHTPDSATHLPSIAIEQERDDSLTRFVNDHTGKLQFKRVGLPDDPHTVICEMSTGTPRPLIPPGCRRAVVEQLHGIAHPGVKATVCLVKEIFLAHHGQRHTRNTRTPTSFIAMLAG